MYKKTLTLVFAILCLVLFQFIAFRMVHERWHDNEVASFSNPQEFVHLPEGKYILFLKGNHKRQVDDFINSLAVKFWLIDSRDKKTVIDFENLKGSSYEHTENSRYYKSVCFLEISESGDYALPDIAMPKGMQFIVINSAYIDFMNKFIVIAVIISILILVYIIWIIKDWPFFQWFVKSVSGYKGWNN